MKLKVAPFRFRPFSLKQKKLLTWWMEGSPAADKDAIIADGAIRAGKTLPMSLSYVFWAMASFNGQNFGMSGKTIGALRRNVIILLKVLLKARGYRVKDHRADNLLVISRNGVTNQFYLFGGKDERSQDLIQGITLAGMYFDEVALMPESFVNQATARCSVDGSKLWFNCNPQGPYHWFKLEWIDKTAEKNALHLHFTMDDNLSLSERIKERYRRMYSGVFFNRFVLGLWVLAEGLIYDMFDEAVHCVDILPERFNRLLMGVDYGTGNPTVFLLLGQLGNAVYVIDEYYWDSSKTGRQKTDAEYSADMRKFISGRYPQAILIDPSAASFKLQLKRDGVAGVREANNDVVDGIRTVATFLGSGRLYIYRRNCPNLLKEFSSYGWDPKAQKRGEDKPLKQSDHAQDALRYCLHTIFGRRGNGAMNKPANW